MTLLILFLADWRNSGGVLVIGYEMLYRIWFAAKRRVLGKATDKVPVSELAARKRELDNLIKAVMNPGPDVIICDEGHRLKSEQADLVKFLRRVQTK